MKKRFFGKAACIGAALLLVSTAVYAGGARAGTARPTTLEFLAPSPVSQVNDFDAVLNEVYRQTDSTLNIRINYVFTTFDDIGQKVSLRIAAGEQLDGAFVAQWTNPNMMQMISQGLLTNLDPYFNNDAYPGLKRYFPAEYLTNNMFTDAKNENHVYAIPFSNSYGVGANAFYYRKDLADKYGIGEIDSYDKLIRFFEAIKQYEPGMDPFSFVGSIDSYARTFLSLYHTLPKTSGHNDIEIPGTGWVIVDDNGLAYAARHFIPTLDPKFRSLLRGPYRDEDPLLAYKLAQEWYQKGYYEKDILNERDHEGEFVAGKAASFPRSLDTYPSILARFQASLPNAELGTFVISDTVRLQTLKTEGVDFKAWNFLAVPSTSRNVDKVMGFMEWIFADRAHHDLLEYGIEGRHWVAAGDDKYDYPPGTDPATNYNFSGYLLTWNPLLNRYPVAMPDSIVNALKRSGDAANFYKRVDAGFTFVTDPVSTELAKMNDLAAYARAIGNGIPTDLDAEIVRVQRLYEEAGIERVAAEIERQFNVFLRSNPYEGQ
ncbi:MAG: extracellular solute-binding protein [Treponema sp.]|jgi:putative aldouronate transport system substrate-binding protein|nr:extracellular solute-binding protein [Treponema sp.]